MNKIARDQLLLLIVATFVCFAALGDYRLFDRDEPRNAGCAVEMLERSDWVVPMFNAELRTHKPVLLYWLTMTAYSLWGVSEFTARMASAVCGVGTVLLCYGIGRRLMSRQAAFWGALALASSLMFVVAARIATPDSLLIFLTTLAMYIYVRGAFVPVEAVPPPIAAARDDGLAPWPGNGSRDPLRPFFPSWLLAILMYGVMGLAILAKGPVGLVLPTAVIGMFLLIVRLPAVPADAVEGSYKGWRRVLWLLRPFAPLHFVQICWSMRPITAVVTAGVVAGPWYYLVDRATQGAWTRGFFLEHNLGRATTAMEGHGASGLVTTIVMMLLFYPVVLCLAFFPWSLLLTPTVLDMTARLRRGDPWRSGYVFLACWVMVFVGLFSLAQTKLPSYITPSYPALALLTGALLAHWVGGTLRAGQRWIGRAMLAMSLLGIAMLVGVFFAARVFLPGDQWLALGALTLPVTAWLVLRYMARGQHAAAVSVLGAGAVVTVSVVLILGPIIVDRHQHSDDLFAMARQHSPTPRYVAFGLLEPTWVFYAGQPIREIEGHRVDQLAQFLESPDAVAITTADRYKDVKGQLPVEIVVLVESPYFMQNLSSRPTLVLLGRLK